MGKLLDAYEKSTEKYRLFGMSWQMLLSFGFTLLALILAILFPLSPYKWLCFAGMALSSLGDLILTPESVFHRFYKGDLLLFGGAVFGVAHICYGHAFYQKAMLHGGVPTLTWVCFAALFGLALVGLPLHTVKSEKPNWKLTAAMLVYAAFICFNCTMIFASAVTVGTFAAYLAFFGALSFYASDAILLCGVVGPKKIPYYDAWIWITYPIAQILLICCA